MEKIDALIDLMKSKGFLKTGTPGYPDRIAEFEKVFLLVLPEDYRRFLEVYGGLTCELFEMWGMEKTEQISNDLPEILFNWRFGFPDVDDNLIPIEDLGEGKFACLKSDNENTHENNAVLLVDISNYASDNQQILANNFHTYLLKRLQEASETLQTPEDYFQKAWKNFEERVLSYQEKFNYDHAEGGKLPRNHDWRPYRYCIQDVVFGVTVVKHNRDENNLLVDVFLTADIPEYGPLAGARALAVFLLSEAFKCGGTMEIQFTGNVEEAHVPVELSKLAEQYQISFSAASDGVIYPNEAKDFYLALTGFGPDLRQKIISLDNQKKVDATRACYVVNHGVWSKQQFEMILLGSEVPDSIFSGSASPDQWQLFHHDLIHCRAAVMADVLLRSLQIRIRQSDDGIQFDIENDARKIESEFDDISYSLKIRSNEKLSIPWSISADNLSVDQNEFFRVFVRARDLSDLKMNMMSDIKKAAQVKEADGLKSFILISQDIALLSDQFNQQVLDNSRKFGVSLIVCPESLDQLDAQVLTKLEQSKIIRK